MGLKEIVLKVLEEAGEDGVVQSELPRITGYSRSYIAEVLRDLEAKGIIRRFRIGKQSYIVKLSKYTAKLKRKTHLKLGILRASEYVYVPLFRRYLKDYGLNVEIVVYDDALTLTRDLALGMVSLALSPIYTQVAVNAVYGGLKVVAGGSLGGASLIVREGIKSINSIRSIASSKISTMDYLVNILLVNELKDYSISIKYITNPDEAVILLYRGVVDAVNLWEPYVSLLKRRSFRELIDYNEYIGEYYCCTLGVHTSLDYNTITKVKRAFSKALSEIKLHIDTLITPYSTITGLPVELIKESIGKYKHLDYIDMGILNRLISRGSKFIVNTQTVLEATCRI